MTHVAAPMEKTFLFDEYVEDARRRMMDAGMNDDVLQESMRNRGHGRTESKKTLLRACAARARAAGREPVRAYVDGDPV